MTKGYFIVKTSTGKLISAPILAAEGETVVVPISSTFMRSNMVSLDGFEDCFNWMMQKTDSEYKG